MNSPAPQKPKPQHRVVQEILHSALISFNPEYQARAVDRLLQLGATKPADLLRSYIVPQESK